MPSPPVWRAIPLTICVAFLYFYFVSEMADLAYKHTVLPMKPTDLYEYDWSVRGLYYFISYMLAGLLGLFGGFHQRTLSDTGQIVKSLKECDFKQPGLIVSGCVLIVRACSHYSPNESLKIAVIGGVLLLLLRA